MTNNTISPIVPESTTTPESATPIFEPRILTADLPRHAGERVLLAGWLHRLRQMGGVSFLVLRDRAGLAQVVIEDAAQVTRIAGLQVESVLQVRGLVVAEPRAALGVEIHAPEIEVLAPVADTLPLEINKPALKANLDTYLDHSPVGMRHPLKQATFRLLGGILDGFAATMRREGFVQITSPKLVGTATEGGAELFKIEYFDRSAYLAQSPQLYKQIMVGVHERVYEIGHAYRAEPHATVRHLNEFVSLDVEFGFIRDHRDVMVMLLTTLRGIMAHLEQHNSADLDTLRVNMPIFGDVPVLKLREAQDLILRLHGEDARHEPDLSPQHERWIGQWAMREHGSDFVFVTHYPVEKRPFYTMPDPADPGYTAGFDLIFRGQELVTGGQRIHRYDQLLANIERWGYRPEAFEGYLDAFKYGMPPEGGFAIGSERLLMRLLEEDNIREVTLFPRDINRLTP